MPECQGPQREAAVKIVQTWMQENRLDGGLNQLKLVHEFMKNSLPALLGSADNNSSNSCSNNNSSSSNTNNPEQQEESNSDGEVALLGLMLKDTSIIDAS